MQTNTKIKPQTETEKLFAIDRPSLGNLSYALRHPETWPEGFEWNYGHCDKCAMGLAHHLWEGIVPETSGDVQKGSSRMARAFALPYEVAEDIFFGGDWAPEKVTGHLWWKQHWVNRALVTPEMVADQIDEYLAEEK